MSVNSKLVSIALSLTFLAQSCTIYKKASITIDEAANANKNVQITRNDGSKFSLTKIEKTDGKYYGTKRVNGQAITLPLKEDEIQKIRIKDTGASRFVTIASIVTGVALVTTIIFLIDFSNDWDEWENSSN